MATEELAPCAVAELGRAPRRPDDVREEDRGEDTFGFRGLNLAYLLEEGCELCDQWHGISNRRDPVRPGQDREPRGWDAFRVVAGGAELLLPRCGRQHERGDADGREDVPDVDLPVQLRERASVAGADAKPEHTCERQPLRATRKRRRDSLEESVPVVVLAPAPLLLAEPVSYSPRVGSHG